MLLDCEPPAAPAHGAVAVSVDGGSVTYTCSTWYNLAGTALRTCQGGGAGWSGSAPLCRQYYFLKTRISPSFSIIIYNSTLTY